MNFPPLLNVQGNNGYQEPVAGAQGGFQGLKKTEESEGNVKTPDKNTSQKTGSGPQLAPGEAGTHQGMMKVMASFEDLLLLLTVLGKETRLAERNNMLMALAEKAATLEASAEKKLEAADKARMGAIASLVMSITSAAISFIGAAAQTKQLQAGFSQLKKQGLDMDSIKNAKTGAGKVPGKEGDGVESAGPSKTGLKNSDPVPESSIQKDASTNKLSKDARKTDDLKQDALKSKDDALSQEKMKSENAVKENAVKEKKTEDIKKDDAQKKDDAVREEQKTLQTKASDAISRDSLISLRSGELNTLSTRVQIRGAFFQAGSQTVQSIGTMVQAWHSADSQTLQAEAEKLQAAAEEIGALLQQAQSQESDFKEFMQNVNNIIREFISAQQKMAEAVAH